MAKKEDLPVLGIALVETTAENLIHSLIYVGKDRILGNVALEKGHVKYDGKVVKPGEKLILERTEDEAKVLEVDGNSYKVMFAKK
jgi:Fe-S cluster assembly ATPase SufC